MLDRFSLLDPRLALSSCPRTVEDIDLLSGVHGVTAVVNLQTDRDLEERGLRWETLWQLYLARGVQAVRVPIADFDKKALLRGLDGAVDAVRAQVAAGRRVLVHCNAGVNRSTTTVVAYLVCDREMAIDEAVSWVVERHPAAEPFPDVVARWAKKRGLGRR